MIIFAGWYNKVKKMTKSELINRLAGSVRLISTGQHNPMLGKFQAASCRHSAKAAEGAAVLVLEAADSARARGARPMGRVRGTGNFQEVVSRSHIAVPFEAVARACRSAMSEAEMETSALSFVLPHGSGTKMGDRLEMRAVKDFLGDGADKVPLAAWKPYTGHMGSASDIGEIILGLRALQGARLANLTQSVAHLLGREVIDVDLHAPGLAARGLGG